MIENSGTAGPSGKIKKLRLLGRSIILARNSGAHIPANDTLDGMLDALVNEQKCKKRFTFKTSRAVHKGPVVCLYFDDADAQELLEIKEGWIVKGQSADGWDWTGEVVDIDWQKPASLGIIAEQPLVHVESGQLCDFFSADYQKGIRSWIEGKRDRSLPDAYKELLQLAAKKAPDAKNTPDTKDCFCLNSTVQALPLRDAQRRALALAERDFGVIWGPPGTGKTYTLAALVNLLRVKESKIVVLAPTNVAADTAALAIDDIRLRLNMPLAAGELIRPGRVHLPELEEREHLMAWSKELEDFRNCLNIIAREKKNLKKRRRELEGQKRKDEQINIASKLAEERQLKAERSRQMWNLANNARIIVSTLHSAIYNEDVLNSIIDEDIILLIDEAGMVPRFFLTRVMELCPSKVFLFGDFKQLGPIRENSNEKDQNSIHWIADSALNAVGLRSITDAEKMEQNGSLVMLTEQSRMRHELCQPVSKEFYGGRLSAVGKFSNQLFARNQPESGVTIADPDAWSQFYNQRRKSELSEVGTKTVTGALEPVEFEAKNEFKARNTCRNSVNSSMQIGQILLEKNAGTQILLLSPFRDQAIELHNQALEEFVDDGRWKAGTVHISQGQEADFVIFSPVNPRHHWLRGGFGKDELDRLFCVTFSRARCQVIVLARPDEIKHCSLLARLCSGAERWAPPAFLQ